MKCPHCLVDFHPYPFNNQLHWRNYPISDHDGSWFADVDKCPTCERVIIHLKAEGSRTPKRVLVHPKGISRAPLSADVPVEFAKDYREACLVLLDSPQASAALSRRCLQHVLRDTAKTKKKDLADQIDEVLPGLPQSLAEMIDTVRVMGNFGAHPMKSTHTGEIIEVEPGEAEWLLDTLEEVFDHYFVKPADRQRKRDAINAKLAEVGKPPLK